MKKALTIAAAAALLAAPVHAQNAARFDAGSWQKAVDEYNAYDRIQFKSEMSRQIIDALRAWEAGK